MKIPDAIELVTFRGFTEAFWRIYGEGGKCQEEVYLMLDQIYFDYFGEHRFSTFDAYRKYRDRQLKKKRQK